MRYDLVRSLILPKFEYALAVQDEQAQLAQQCEKVFEAAVKWMTTAKKPKMVSRARAALGLEDARIRRWKANRALRDRLKAALELKEEGSTGW